MFTFTKHALTVTCIYKKSNCIYKMNENYYYLKRPCKLVSLDLQY